MAHTIPKKHGLPKLTSFEALRKEGIQLLQTMSVDVWTDYNLHDPGVTILEQLCFALTDLVYRSDFSVEDQLTGEDGKIAFGDQALHLPEEILPCRPTAAVDYRQLILDSCPAVDFVWFESSTDAELQAACPGIYAATVRQFEKSASGNIAANVRNSFATGHNLCEDIHDTVVVLENLDCHLLGEIEISGSHDPSDILGQIYHRAVSYIASNVQIRQQEKIADNDENLIDMLTGPLSKHGRRQLEVAAGANDKVILADLIGILNDVPGVMRVRDLSIKVMHADKPKIYHDIVPRRHTKAALWLQIPQSEIEGSEKSGMLRLLHNGRPIKAPIEDSWNKFVQLIHVDRDTRVIKADPAKLYAQPKGVRRNFLDYYSIQNNFPGAYGINAHGVPRTTPSDSPAVAKQLKAYLMLFEQIMANHLANVDGVRELFANAGHDGPTYRHQVLDNTTIKNSEELYVEKSKDFLPKVMAECDHAAERKSRQLDHMLAVFGESHTQKSLRHFSCYSSPRDPNKEVVRNKRNYLSSIVEVTRDRVGGTDWTNCKSICGFARRVGLLLGFDEQRSWLSNTMCDPGGSVMRSKSSGAMADLVPDTHFGVPEMSSDSWSGKERRDASLHALYILRESKYTRRLFADGTKMENYRIAYGLHPGRWTLILGSTADPGWQPLVRSADMTRLARAANELRRGLIDLCRESEGLYVVEHVMLRPACAKLEHDVDVAKKPNWDRLSEPHNDKGDPWQGFYPLRFSVFFPNWTARCSDPHFQSLAEETIRINSPAHVHGQCFWLNFEDMRKFEELFHDWTRAFHNWTSARQHPGAKPWNVDDCAVKLIDFVLNEQECLQRHEKDGHD